MACQILTPFFSFLNNKECSDSVLQDSVFVLFNSHWFGLMMIMMMIIMMMMMTMTMMIMMMMMVVGQRIGSGVADSSNRYTVAHAYSN